MSGATGLAVDASAADLLVRVDSALSLRGEGPLQVAVEVRLPDPARFAAPKAVLFCVPGGGMNRRFFDLKPDAATTDFSLAEQMCARGHIVAMIDPPGIGDSSPVRDAYALTPDVLVRANARAVERIVSGLRAGTFSDALAPLPAIKAVGLGHSMGAMLAILQQAQTGAFDALALLGFSTAGLPQYLGEAVRAALAKGPIAREALPALARAQFEAAASQRHGATARGDDLFAAANVDPRGVRALNAAMAPILPVPSLLAMLPGNVAAECARIEVPVLLAVGDRDLTGPAHAIPDAFSASRDVALQVLAQSGHSHFLFAARAQLFARLAAWLAAL